VTPRCPSWFTNLQPLALVANPRLELRQLDMRKNVICEMKANMKEGLPLRLVNSHGISQTQRK
jgi:hypothetical protein